MTGIVYQNKIKIANNIAVFIEKETRNLKISFIYTTQK